MKLASKVDHLRNNLGVTAVEIEMVAYVLRAERHLNGRSYDFLLTSEHIQTSNNRPLIMITASRLKCVFPTSTAKANRIDRGGQDSAVFKVSEVQGDVGSLEIPCAVKVISHITYEDGFHSSFQRFLIEITILKQLRKV